METKHFPKIGTRVYTLAGVVLLLFTIFTVSLAYIQLIEGAKGTEIAKNNRTVKDSDIPAIRGGIYDANANVLANSVNRYNLVIDPVNAKKWVPKDCTEDNLDVCNQIDGKPVGANGILGISKLLASTLKVSAQELAYTLDKEELDERSEPLRAVILKQNLTPDEKHAVERLNIKGILRLDSTSQRVYPQGNIAGSIVGAYNLGPDGEATSRAGIEELVNEELSGKDGSRSFEFERQQGARIPTAEYSETPPQNGKDIRTTIDIDIQLHLQRLLDDMIDRTKSEIGYGVVEEVQTGKIFAIASSHEPSAGTPEATNGSKVFVSAFEPGSTNKVLTAAGLIEAGLQTPMSSFVVPNHMKTQLGEEIKDYNDHATIPLTLAGIVGNSYNTGTVMASEAWPIDQRWTFYRKMGISRYTGVGFPGEGVGLLSDWETWDNRTRDIVTFGQGFAATPLQMVNAYAAYGNNGINPIPTLISGIREQNGEWQDYSVKTKQPEQVVTPGTAEQVRGILESCVVYTGSCRSAGIPDYRIGGKTGTAEELATNDFVHSFIGMFPMDKPRFVVGVFVQDKSDQNTIPLTIPIFKDLSTFIIQKYALPPSTPAEYVYPAVPPQ
jgi:cell division protein FtsI (penicillin-binding protein 3)